MSRIHLIAVGGSVMHNLALALSNQGHQISGSDDQIYEPAKSRLAAAGILPEIEGWDANRIDQKLD
ncbi:MAG: Mur ligase domain-containing protein, partial [Saprospiraceae bacterium]